MSESHNPYELQSVSNALSILDLLNEHEELNLVETAKLINVSTTTAFRLLHTLELHGYVTKSDQSKYRLGIKMAAMGDTVSRRMEIARIVHPYLERLSLQFQETSHLVVWNSRTDVIVADRIIGKSPISYKTTTGFITPAHAAASGRVLLAYTDPEHVEEYVHRADYSSYQHCIPDEATLRQTITRIRRTGVAENEGDAIPGLSCYAVPLFDRSGKAIASLSVSGAQTNMNRSKEQIIQALRDCAEKIDQQLLETGISAGTVE